MSQHSDNVISWSTVPMTLPAVSQHSDNVISWSTVPVTLPPVSQHSDNVISWSTVPVTLPPVSQHSDNVISWSTVPMTLGSGSALPTPRCTTQSTPPHRYTVHYNTNATIQVNTIHNSSKLNTKINTTTETIKSTQCKTKVHTIQQKK